MHFVTFFFMNFKIYQHLDFELALIISLTLFSLSLEPQPRPNYRHLSRHPITDVEFSDRRNSFFIKVLFHAFKKDPGIAKFKNKNNAEAILPVRQLVNIWLAQLHFRTGLIKLEVSAWVQLIHCYTVCKPELRYPDHNMIQECHLKQQYGVLF